eukprot:15430807-Alexandrium_andersonii.AAC.1
MDDMNNHLEMPVAFQDPGLNCQSPVFIGRLQWLVKVSSGPKIQPEGAEVPARPTGQTALSAAPNRR